MQGFVTTYEPAIRLVCFAGFFVTLAMVEQFAPKRAKPSGTLYRWLNNLSLFFIATLLVRLLVPVLPVAAAVWASIHSVGMLYFIPLGDAGQFIAAFLLLDFVVYWQHRLSHQVPILWRLHRVHHADLDLDITTALRFHPAEIVLSVLLKVAAVLLLGAPVLAVTIFEIVLNAGALFNHANISLPDKWDERLRRCLVTPDFHRVHHSQLQHETDSNYGFFISWWDYCFRSYVAQPSLGHQGIEIGLAQYPTPDKATRLDRLVLMPLGSPTTPKDQSL
jgi:sterol desaturase/sphingolipid hydroxylase (fatty acid hydroxylase superfamily)